MTELEGVVADFDADAPMLAEAMRSPRSHRGGPRPVVLPEGWLEDPDEDRLLGREAEQLVSGG